jgi:hypothetical protein
MSRSRRLQKLEKCICGRHLIPYVEHTRGCDPKAECTVLNYVDERNEQFLKYRELRSRPLSEED